MFDRLLFLASDARLVRAALAGRAAALEALVRRYQRQAHAVARAAGASGEDVEDAVQDAFLRAIERLPDLREPGRFGPWLLQIVRNLTRSRLRRARPQPLSDGDAASACAAGGDPALGIERRELEERIRASVAALPESLREPLFLYYYEDRSLGEVAKALSISRLAARKRLERARSLLRERLWRSLREDIEALVPAAAEWRRRGRRLGLLLLGVSAASWGAAPAALEGAADCLSAASSISHASRLGIGGAIMGSKKAITAAAAGLCLLGGGIYMTWRAPRLDRPAPEVATGIASAPTPAARAPADGARDAGLDASARALPAAAGNASTDPTAASLSGRVLDAGGRGVAGAEVAVLDLRGWDQAIEEATAALRERETRDLTEAVRQASQEVLRRLATVAKTQSGAAGEFLAHGLQEGEHRVLVRHPEFLPHAESIVDLRAGETARRDIALEAGRELRGRVVDAAGQPIAAARIVARPSEERHARGEARRQRLVEGWTTARSLLIDGEAASDAGGGFRLVVAPGVYDLIARGAGVAPGRRFDVEVPGAEVVLQLSRGLTLRGRVVDPSAAPLPKARVRLERRPDERPAPTRVAMPEFEHVPSGLDAAAADARSTGSDAAGRFAFERRDYTRAETGAAVAGARSDSRGGYRLRALPERALSLVARAPGHRYGRLQALAAGEEPERFVLIRLARLAGSVRDAESGLAVGSFHIVLRVKDAADGGHEMLPREYGDPSGRFALEGLAPGIYYLGVASPLHAFWGSEVELRAGEATTVDAEIERGRTLRGHVADAETGLPLEGVRVLCHSRGQDAIESWVMSAPPPSESSGADGSFEIRGLARGKRAVWFHLDGHFPGKDGIKIDIGDGDPEPLRLTMFRGGSVRGGAAVPEPDESLGNRSELHVELRGADGKRDGRHWARPDEKGKFRIDGVRPGRYAVVLVEESIDPKKVKPDGSFRYDDMTKRETPLGEVEVRAGEEAVVGGGE
jgi:RNA polymerase sigma-70 factor (ECF subfamily)